MSEAGAFFAIDRRSWADVCDLGSVNAAVAYLVLARGALKDHRTSSWSTNAIESYAGVPRHLAKDAVARLINSRYVEQQRGGSRPRYYLVPWPEDEEPDWIWLPASVIDGAEAELPPVALLRRTQNLPALRLFVDLYGAQSLERYGGVWWQCVRREFTKEKVGTYGAHVVYGFLRGQDRAWLRQPAVSPHVSDDGTLGAFWPLLKLLEDTGLIVFVPHLIEGDTAEAGILFPYGGDGALKEERAIARAAHRAGLSMLTDWQMRSADDQGMALVPLLQHEAAAEMVGIIRLRYQANTASNRIWHDRRDGWAEKAREFLELAEKAEQSQGIATSNRYPFGI